MRSSSSKVTFQTASALRPPSQSQTSPSASLTVAHTPSCCTGTVPSLPGSILAFSYHPPLSLQFPSVDQDSLHFSPLPTGCETLVSLTRAHFTEPARMAPKRKRSESEDEKDSDELRATTVEEESGPLPAAVSKFRPASTAAVQRI